MTNQGKVKNNEKLWTPNFLLLWQGQFVSSMGDVLYDMAMGLWILAVTGSTALMGTLMAASILPRTLISPFAGVIVDRTDRKQLMILMDILRGAVILFVSVAAFKGFLTIWMVFTAGIFLGIGSAFFGPAVGSVVPDTVHHSKLMSANSTFGMIQAGASIIGKPLGGVLFQFLGAPVMFLFNGMSYIISGALTLFLKIPKLEKPRIEKNFIEDMKEGFHFVWKIQGLRYTIMILSIVSFVGSVASVLFLPLFQTTAGLGPVKLGIAVAFITAGSLLGMMLLSVVKIPPAKRFSILIIGATISFISFFLFALVESFPGMVFFLFIGGAFSSVLNVFMPASMQLIVPPEMRGKVFSLAGMLSQGLMPLGMGLGGILGEFIPLRTIMIFAYAVELIIFLAIVFIPSMKRFINFDPETETLDQIL